MATCSDCALYAPRTATEGECSINGPVPVPDVPAAGIASFHRTCAEALCRAWVRSDRSSRQRTRRFSTILKRCCSSMTIPDSFTTSQGCCETSLFLYRGVPDGIRAGARQRHRFDLTSPGKDPARVPDKLLLLYFGHALMQRPHRSPPSTLNIYSAHFFR